MIACLMIKLYIGHRKGLKAIIIICMNTEEINKVLLSSNDGKRLQTSEKITTYPYGTDERTIKQS